jgi:predicted transposase YdaD
MLGLDLEEPRAFREAREAGFAKGQEEGHAEGREQEARSLIIRLLSHKFGELPEASLNRIQALSLEQLESLGEALLDFANLTDLETWLVGHQG